MSGTVETSATAVHGVSETSGQATDVSGSASAVATHVSAAGETSADATASEVSAPGAGLEGGAGSVTGSEASAHGDGRSPASETAGAGNAHRDANSAASIDADVTVAADASIDVDNAWLDDDLVDPALAGNPGVSPPSTSRRPGVVGISGGPARLTALIDGGLSVDGLLLRLGDVGPVAHLHEDAGYTRVDAGAGVTVDARLAHDVVGSDGATQLVVRARGEQNLSATSVLRFHLVLDRSSSMQSSWRAVLAAAERFVDGLAPTDELQIVAYGSEAEVVLAASTVGDGSAARHALHSIGVGGGTNIEAGLRLAYGSAHARSRVLLLSDGVPNAGALGVEEIAPIVADARARIRCTTIAVGVGDQFDRRVLEQVARAGGGAYHFARDAGELAPVLEAEVRALRLAVDAGLELTISAPGGVVLAGGPALIRVPPLRAGESRRFVFDVTLGAGAEVAANIRAKRPNGEVRTAQVSVSRGFEARSEGSQAVFADHHLGVTLDAAAGDVLNGRATDAAAKLRAHVAFVDADGGALGVRGEATLRLATALETLVPSAGHRERRELSLAMGGLAVRLGL